MHNQPAGSGDCIPKSFKGRIRNYRCCTRLVVCAVLGINKSLEKPRYNGLLFYNRSQSMKFGNLPRPMCSSEKSKKREK